MSFEKPKTKHILWVPLCSQLEPDLMTEFALFLGMDIPRSISIPPQITYAYLLLHVGMSTLFVLWNSKSSEIPLCKEKGIRS